LASRDVYLDLAMRAGNYRPPEAWYPHTRFTRALWLKFFDLKNREKVRLAGILTYGPLLGNPSTDANQLLKTVREYLQDYRDCFPYISFGETQYVEQQSVDEDIQAYKQMFPDK
jgi:hypothetical protein